jgi:hypothetical protein
MRELTYEPPSLTILGSVESLTEGGQGTGDGTGSIVSKTTPGTDAGTAG